MPRLRRGHPAVPPAVPPAQAPPAVPQAPFAMPRLRRGHPPVAVSATPQQRAPRAPIFRVLRSAAHFVEKKYFCDIAGCQRFAVLGKFFLKKSCEKIWPVQKLAVILHRFSPHELQNE